MGGRRRLTAIACGFLLALAPVLVRADTYGSGGYGSGSFAGFPPTVTTQAANSIGQTSATLNGTITDIGTTSPAVRGFVYGSDTTYGATTTDSAGPFSTGAFTATLSGLTCNTGYHVAAYATSTNGIGYGSDTSFNTSACTPSSSGGGGGGGGGGGNGPIVASLPSPAAAPTPTAPSSSSAAAPKSTAATNPAASVPAATSACGTAQPAFTRTLGRGMKGDDVRHLQVFLNTHGFEIAATGDGSPGHESDEFGAKTEAALIRFQEANALAINIVKFTGLFGDATRTYINSLLADGTCTDAATTHSAEPATATTTGTEASSPEIAALRQRVEELRTMLAELLQARSGGAQDAAAPAASAAYSRDLQIGSTGEDVRYLQIFLNDSGYPLSQTGPGSPGEETDYFGTATYRALARFQTAHRLPATGYFGPLTRALIASMTAPTAQ